MSTQKFIRISGSLLDLSVPKVMGVINVTPDSFYTGSRQMQLDDVLKVAGKMLADGADLLDVGGYSTRPGAVDISEQEEIDRVEPVISALADHYPSCIISIDTFRAKVAEAALNAGAALVNDVSGGDLDSDMFPLVAERRVPYILMHMRGTPQTMVSQAHYADVTKEVLFELSAKVEKLESMGVADIVVDPGFGFAKDINQNFELMSQLEMLQWLEKPILVGISRKSMIYKSLNIGADEALNGTTVLNTVALLKGASLLRVHDVKEAKQAVALLTKLKS